MPPESLNTTELHALRRFLAIWCDETTKCGFADIGYMTAAHHELRGWTLYTQLRSAVGHDAAKAMALQSFPEAA